MPRGPKGEKRPADAIGAAVMVGRIATGEISEQMALPSGTSAPTLPLSVRTGTIKQRVLALLDENPNGLTSGQILDGLKMSGLPALARESLSPQLSRLRNKDKVIELNRGVWTRKKHESQDA